MTTDILETGTLSFRIPSIFFYYHFLTGRRLLFLFGLAVLSVSPLPMTFKAPHDLASVYLAHLPTPCRAPLACSQFP